jgi:hypothetical protein
MELIKINSVEISLTKEGENVFVPIKPICEALGIDHSSQFQCIKEHVLLGPTVVQIPTVGGDGKLREMLCLPIKSIFGWLCLIDARKVKPEAFDTVIVWQKKAYEVLYEKYFMEPILQKKKLMRMLELENQMLKLESDRKDINASIKAIKEEYEDVRAKPPTQLGFEFPDIS